MLLRLGGATQRDQRGAVEGPRARLGEGGARDVPGGLPEDAPRARPVERGGRLEGRHLTLVLRARQRHEPPRIQRAVVRLRDHLHDERCDHGDVTLAARAALAEQHGAVARRDEPEVDVICQEPRLELALAERPAGRGVVLPERVEACHPDLPARLLALRIGALVEHDVDSLSTRGGADETEARHRLSKDEPAARRLAEPVAARHRRRPQLDLRAAGHQPLERLLLRHGRLLLRLLLVAALLRRGLGLRLRSGLRFVLLRLWLLGWLGRSQLEREEGGPHRHERVRGGVDAGGRSHEVGVERPQARPAPLDRREREGALRGFERGVQVRARDHEGAPGGSVGPDDARDQRLCARVIDVGEGAGRAADRRERRFERDRRDGPERHAIGPGRGERADVRLGGAS